MSEKKTTSKKVHTLTLEDQTKLAQANVKKMEQGKIEVMKDRKSTRLNSSH